MRITCEHTDRKLYTVLTVGTNRPIEVCRECFKEMYGVYPDANIRQLPKPMLCKKK